MWSSNFKRRRTRDFCFDDDDDDDDDEEEEDYDNDDEDDEYDEDDDRMHDIQSDSSSEPDGEDIISSLPDTVLCHILSFLPTKLAVRMSILAQRWRFLWASVPVLDFDDTLLFNRNKGGVYGIGGVNFINFVDRVLVRTFESSTRKFRLHCSRRRSFHLNSWINVAVKRKVEELDLCIDRVIDYRLSCTLFASENLVVLKLGRNFVLDISGSFSFPSLKIFHLDSIEFSRSSSTKNLFSSCRALEELILQECKLNHIKSLHVAAPALKSLAIDCFSYERYDDYYYEEEDEENADYWAGNGNEYTEYRIVVDAPKLEDLNLKDYVAYGYSFKNIHSLIRAEIDLALRDLNRSFNRKKPNVTQSGLNILSGISNAKFLKLSGSSLKVFSLVNHDFPVFYNLTELKLRCDEHCGLLLPKLLQSSPNLEVLVIGEQNAPPRDLKNFVWEPPSSVPECLSKHLKTIRIWGFNGQENVAKFTAYLQENGNVSLES